MQKIPLEERPRERLLHAGEESLSDSELLAILLGSGTSKISAAGLAHNLLKHFGGLATLSEASIEELCQIHGIGPVKAIELRALFALAKRLLKKNQTVKTKIDSSEAAYHALIDLFYGEKKEILAVLMLDARLTLIGREVVSVGTLTEVLLHPREVFLPAIKRGAHSIVLAHNHPSNDLSPSREDLEVTERLSLAGKVLDIAVNDHLIICDDRYRSLMLGDL